MFHGLMTKYLYMMNKYLVEDCELLPVGQLKTTWPIINLETKELVLKSGLKIRYHERDFDDGRFLVIEYCAGRWTTQTIKIDTWPITFGMRRFLLCQCGRRCSTLYMRPDRPHAFTCRYCGDLKYGLSYLNKRTKAGRVFYAAHWMNKSMELQERIHRIDYRNMPTKKAMRFIKMSQKNSTISADLVKHKH